MTWRAVLGTSVPTAEGSKLRITTNAVTSMRSCLDMEEFLGLVVSRNVIATGEWPGLARWGIW
jgi:hypothetical protein